MLPVSPHSPKGRMLWKQGLLQTKRRPFPVTTFPSRNTTESWSPTLQQALAQDPERLSNIPHPNPLLSCCTRKVYIPTPTGNSYLCICPCDTPVKKLSATSPFLCRANETKKQRTCPHGKTVRIKQIRKVNSMISTFKSLCGMAGDIKSKGFHML